MLLTCSSSSCFPILLIIAATMIDTSTPTKKG